jgi:hypothetical protein
MIKLWSELPRARSRELLADVATLIWVVFWAIVVWRLFVFLSSFAEAGRSVQAGGNTMIQSGRNLGESLAGLPLVGAQVRDIARDAFSGAGTPLASFGTELERFIFVIAFALAALLAIVTLQPWLSRYVPWRLTRVRRVRAAHQAIRTGPDRSEADTQRLLAMRAVSRLDYADLLEYTPDPLGDWAAGRHAALARAELASQGLDAP